MTIRSFAIASMVLVFVVAVTLSQSVHAQDTSNPEETNPHIGLWGGMVWTFASGSYHRSDGLVMKNASGPGALVRFSIEPASGERWAMAGFELNGGIIMRTVEQQYYEIENMKVITAVDMQLRRMDVVISKHHIGSFSAATLGASFRLNPVDWLHLGVGFDVHLPLVANLTYRERLFTDRIEMPGIGVTDLWLVQHNDGDRRTLDHDDTRVNEWVNAQTVTQVYYGFFAGTDLPLSDDLWGRARLQVTVPRGDMFERDRLSFRSADLLIGLRWRL